MRKLEEFEKELNLNLGKYGSFFVNFSDWRICDIIAEIVNTNIDPHADDVHAQIEAIEDEIYDNLHDIIKKWIINYLKIKMHITHINKQQEEEILKMFEKYNTSMANLRELRAELEEIFNKRQLLEYYKMAQKTVKALGDFYDKHTDFLSTHNLKLYDACYYNCSEEMQKDFPLCYSNSQKNDVNYFYEFCEQAYEDYRNLYRYHADNEKYIGRTSSFYFIPQGASDYIDSSTYKNRENFIGDLFSYIVDDANASYYISLSEKNNILFDDKEEVLKNTEIYENVCCYLEDIGKYDIDLLFADALKLYEYIDDFKENQVEYFKDFLHNEEETLFFDNKAENENFNALERCIAKGLEGDSYSDSEKAYISLILENARGEIL